MQAEQSGRATNPDLLYHSASTWITPGCLRPAANLGAFHRAKIGPVKRMASNTECDSTAPGANATQRYGSRHGRSSQLRPKPGPSTQPKPALAWGPTEEGTKGETGWTKMPAEPRGCSSKTGLAGQRCSGGTQRHHLAASPHTPHPHAPRIFAPPTPPAGTGNHVSRRHLQTEQRLQAGPNGARISTRRGSSWRDESASAPRPALGFPRPHRVAGGGKRRSVSPTRRGETRGSPHLAPFSLRMWYNSGALLRRHSQK